MEKASRSMRSHQLLSISSGTAIKFDTGLKPHQVVVQCIELAPNSYIGMQWSTVASQQRPLQWWQLDQLQPATESRTQREHVCSDTGISLELTLRIVHKETSRPAFRCRIAAIGSTRPSLVNRPILDSMPVPWPTACQ
eukprot:5730052-Amphidinium_carterae.1